MRVCRKRCGTLKGGIVKFFGEGEGQLRMFSLASISEGLPIVSIETQAVGLLFIENG